MASHLGYDSEWETVHLVYGAHSPNPRTSGESVGEPIQVACSGSGSGALITVLGRVRKVPGQEEFTGLFGQLDHRNDIPMV